MQPFRMCSLCNISLHMNTFKQVHLFEWTSHGWCLSQTHTRTRSQSRGKISSIDEPLVLGGNLILLRRPQVFTVTVPARQQELAAVEALVARMAPGARRTYALGGTQKFELPSNEVSLSQVGRPLYFISSPSVTTIRGTCCHHVCAECTP